MEELPDYKILEQNIYDIQIQVGYEEWNPCFVGGGTWGV